jgi:hypothetical protein
MQDQTMTAQPLAIIWIDHAQARVIRFGPESSSLSVIHPAGGTPHLHHKANSVDSGHRAEDQAYLHDVGQALAGIDSALVAGPATIRCCWKKCPACRRWIIPPTASCWIWPAAISG